MINLKSIPFFKILLVYLIGIGIALNCGILKSVHVLFLCSTLLSVVLFIYQKQTKSAKIKQWFHIISFNIFLIILAQESYYLYQARNNKDHCCQWISSNAQHFIGKVTDIPVSKETVIKIPLSINAIEQNNKWHYCTGEIILYLKKDSASNISLGDNLLIDATFNTLNEPKNPYEFNYKEFLNQKNIYHTSYVTQKNLHKIYDINAYSLIDFGTAIKQYIIQILRSCHLSQNAFSICSALLVGYDDEIEGDVMQSFAHSGTLHVLSVSGMHTGILYGLIIWLFNIFDKNNRFKFLKCITIIISLALFTSVTGFSPSVLRASIMLSFIVIGNTFYKNGNSFNTLFLSAFILLLYNPLLVNDIGFLLSYAAVFGILYFYPLFKEWHTFENAIIQWAYNLTLISISATIATLPISLVSFHQFPIWFALSNLIIIPLTTILIALTAIIICFNKIIFIKAGISVIINYITQLTLWIANLTNSPTYGYIDAISFSKTDTIFLTTSMFFICLIYTYKNYKHILLFCFIIITWLGTSIVLNIKQSFEKEIVVFHVKKKPVFLVRTGKTIYLNTSALSHSEYERYVKPYLLTISHSKIITLDFNYVTLNDFKIIHGNHFNNQFKTSSHDFIIMSNDQPINLSYVDEKTLIVADCSNSYRFIKKIKKQCLKLGLQFYDVKNEGAFQKTLN